MLGLQGNHHLQEKLAHPLSQQASVLRNCEMLQQLLAGARLNSLSNGSTKMKMSTTYVERKRRWVHKLAQQLMQPAEELLLQEQAEKQAEEEKAAKAAAKKAAKKKVGLCVLHTCFNWGTAPTLAS